MYQVDESPRYASVGRWQHTASFSTWLSADTWRPLPRREWSVRDDYHVLLGTNRHTVGPTGWLQEENNLKAVLTRRARSIPRGRTSGASTASRATSAYASTTSLLPIATTSARDRSGTACATRGRRPSHSRARSRCAAPVDKLGLFGPLFARADAIEAGASPAGDEDARVIRAALTDMGALR